MVSWSPISKTATGDSADATLAAGPGSKIRSDLDIHRAADHRPLAMTSILSGLLELPALLLGLATR